MQLTVEFPGRRESVAVRDDEAQDQPVVIRIRDVESLALVHLDLADGPLGQHNLLDLEATYQEREIAEGRQTPAGEPAS